MDVTKTHRVIGGISLTYLDAADVSLVFFQDTDGIEQVRLVLADGRAFTRMDLGEFCELLYAVRKEISGRHWGKTESIEDVMRKMNPETTPASC